MPSAGPAKPFLELARDPERFANLFTSRRDLYSLADVHIPIESDDPEVTVAAILSHPVLQ